MTTPVAPLAYTHKPPNIEVVKWENGVTDIEALADWMNTDVPDAFALRIGAMGGTLYVYHEATDTTWSANNGRYIAKDVNGKFFKLEVDELVGFYDPIL